MGGWGSKRTRIGALAAAGALVAGAAAVLTNGPGGGAGQHASARQDAVAFTVTLAKPVSGQGAGIKTIGYLGRGFAVPAAWQVVDLSAHPTACVRFDVHAVYVGTPGAQQNCPARGVGRHTGAVLIQPRPARSAVTAVKTVDHPAAAEIDAAAPGMSVTASYSGADRAAVVGALAAARLPSPVVSAVPVPPNAPLPTLTVTAPPTALASSLSVSSLSGPWLTLPPSSVPSVQSVAPLPAPALSPSQDSAAAASPIASSEPSTGHRGGAAGSSGVPLSATNTVSGLGFDACAAPNASTMAAWTAPNSPFTAVGIYIGGSERACEQPNLTAAWVGSEARAGWHFMPLYVGWQAAWDYDPAEPVTLPAQLGRQSADDAVTQARALGFDTGSVLYYDMEGYSSSASGAAMSFLSAWSSELRAKGYRSAVYSSLNSGIHDLVANIGKIAEPDVIDVAHWNSTADADPGAAPSGDWPHQRVHQYQGGANATYGRVTINIDRDFFDLDLAACVAPAGLDLRLAPNASPGTLCALTVAIP